MIIQGILIILHRELRRLYYTNVIKLFNTLYIILRSFIKFSNLIVKQFYIKILKLRYLNAWYISMFLTNFLYISIYEIYKKEKKEFSREFYQLKHITFISLPIELI